MPSLNTGNAILSNALKVDSSYNVGIGGAASGTNKLQVTGIASANSFIPTSSTIPSNGMYLSAANTLGFSTNSTLDMVINEAGRVGIGTASPSNITGYGGLTINGTSGAYTYWNINGTDTGRIITDSANFFFDNVSTGSLVFRTTSGSTERMRITSAGNVGIGTNSPIFALDINTSSFKTFRIQSSDDAIVTIGSTIASSQNWSFGATANASGQGSNIFFIGTSTNNPSGLLTKNFVINSSGNVGIGTSSPSGNGVLLNTRGISGNTTSMLISESFDGGSMVSLYSGGSSGDNPSLIYLKDLRFGSGNKDTSGYVERMRITSGGNVLIGTTSNASNYKFVVSSNAYVPQYLAMGVNDDGRYIGQGNIISGAFQSYDLTIVNYATSGRVTITNGSNGVVLNNGATSWSTFSDERLKNINGGIENAVDKLLSIRAVKYSWKTDKTNKENLGLIAQDIEKVFPQVVDESKSFNEGDDTEYLSVKYTELIPVLVKAIQELNERIKQLENK